MRVKIWLDDEREPPDSTWIWFDSAFKVIEALEVLDVDILDLDHDLGDDKKYGTGYDVMKYLEERVFDDVTYEPPYMTLHTQNPVGYEKMSQARESIRRMIARRTG